jgi:hypothetical protein
MPREKRPTPGPLPLSPPPRHVTPAPTRWPRSRDKPDAWAQVPLSRMSGAGAPCSPAPSPMEARERCGGAADRTRLQGGNLPQGQTLTACHGVAGAVRAFSSSRIREPTPLPR